MVLGKNPEVECFDCTKSDAGVRTRGCWSIESGLFQITVRRLGFFPTEFTSTDEYVKTVLR